MRQTKIDEFLELAHHNKELEKITDAKPKAKAEYC